MTYDEAETIFLDLLEYVYDRGGKILKNQRPEMSDVSINNHLRILSLNFLQEVKHFEVSEKFNKSLLEYHIDAIAESVSEDEFQEVVKGEIRNAIHQKTKETK